ncbi:MAG: SDR family oxidoreductase [Chloroflexota bacterium]|nr:SDR family oxidoreductase [Chloroflexota bacterium]MDE2931425.1 SDR family oxidoreductase [Chloroflexota bacterium]
MKMESTSDQPRGEFLDGIFGLNEEVAIVGGGTGILGGVIAEYLGKAGAKVAVLGRNQEQGQRRVDTIEASGGEAIFVPYVATDADSVAQAHAQVRDVFGTVTVAVNAVGGNQPSAVVNADQAFEELTLDAVRENLDLNLTSAWLACQEFGPAMLANGRGSVINIGSMAGGERPLSRVPVYAIAKSGVATLTYFLAREWQGVVRVNMIVPGFFETTQNRGLLRNPDGSLSERGEQIVAHTPVGRFGEPDEVGGAAVYLASRASAFTTGLAFVIDGGFSVQSI